MTPEEQYKLDEAMFGMPNETEGEDLDQSPAPVTPIVSPAVTAVPTATATLDITATIIEDEVQKRLGLKDDKVTLGGIINAVVYLSAVIPHDGGLLLKLIKDKIRNDNLPIDFITAEEQAKLRAFEINNLPAGTPPIPLDQIIQMSQGFLDLVDDLNGTPGKLGLLDQFEQMGNDVGTLKGQSITPSERSKISGLAFMSTVYDPASGTYGSMDIAELRTQLGTITAQPGTGLAPSDQLKLNTFTYDSMRPDILGSTKDIELAQKQVVSTDDVALIADNRLITVSNVHEIVTDLETQTSRAFVQYEEALNLLPLVTPEEKTKLGYINYTSTRFQIGKEQFWVGSGLEDVNIHLDNEIGKNATISGGGSVGEWFIGTFPNSTTHADDFVISNPANGGIVLDVKTGSKVRFRDTNGYQTVSTISSGDTASRPTAEVGQQYFDTDLGQPVWFNGTDWVDAMGKIA